MTTNDVPVGPFSIIETAGTRSVVSAGEMAWIRASMVLRSKKLADRCMTTTDPENRVASSRYAGEYVLTLDATEMEQLRRVPGVVIEQDEVAA